MKVQDKIEMLEIAALAPYAHNARTHSKEQIAQIARSIQEFGFTNPVLIDGQGGIVAGHGRVLAAQSLGVGSVPCLRVDWLTEAQKRAYKEHIHLYSHMRMLFGNALTLITEKLAANDWPAWCL